VRVYIEQMNNTATPTSIIHRLLAYLDDAETQSTEYAAAAAAVAVIARPQTPLADEVNRLQRMSEEMDDEAEHLREELIGLGYGGGRP
jgi:hypothetical protein